PRHPPRHRRDRPGFGGAGLRPPASTADEAVRILTARSPDGALRNPGLSITAGAVPDYASLHPGYDLQYSGGSCAIFSAPSITAPSAKRSGKLRAFLPSRVLSVPSA